MKRKIVIALLILAPLVAVRATDEKLPPEMRDRIRNVQLHQVNLGAQLLQLQITYKNTQESIAADSEQLKSLSAEALSTAKLDPEKWAVDLDKLTFVEKKPPTEKK